MYINCNTSQLKLKIFKKFTHINKTKHIIDAYMCIGDSHKINNIPLIDPSLNKIRYFVKKKWLVSNMFTLMNIVNINIY